jgi:hypothetical protein
MRRRMSKWGMVTPGLPQSSRPRPAKLVHLEGQPESSADRTVPPPYYFHGEATLGTIETGLPCLIALLVVDPIAENLVFRSAEEVNRQYMSVMETVKHFRNSRVH